MTLRRPRRAWLVAAGITDGAVFRAVERYVHVAKSRPSDRTVARVVRRAALAADSDTARYGGHSLQLRITFHGVDRSVRSWRARPSR